MATVIQNQMGPYEDIDQQMSRAINVRKFRDFNKFANINSTLKSPLGCALALAT